MMMMMMEEKKEKREQRFYVVRNCPNVRKRAKLLCMDAWMFHNFVPLSLLRTRSATHKAVFFPASMR